MKKTILITGATCELGQAISKFLIKKDCQLILASRSKEKLQALSKSLKTKNLLVDYAVFDFSKKDTFSNIVKKISTVSNNGLDGLIIMPPQPPATTNSLPDETSWHELFNNSFIAPALLIKEIMPSLILKTISRILLVSGISSKQPLSQYATSNVLRTSWLGLAKTIADQYGPKGLRFNTLSLGGIMTDKFKKQIDSESQEKEIASEKILLERFNNVPLRRYAELCEIAEMIDFLLLSSGSTHLTGQNIVLDGGFTRSY